MTLSLFTAPTEEPITVSDALDFCRIEAETDDTVVDSLIVVARRHIEGAVLNRSLLTQTWDWTLDSFPCATSTNPYGSLIVPRPPLQSITSISYVDTAGATQTFSSANYMVDTAIEPGRVNLVYGQSWPSTSCIPNAVTVRFVAGWTAPADIPEEIKQAIKVYVGTLYENRESLVIGQTPSEIPILDRLLADYRMYAVA